MKKSHLLLLVIAFFALTQSSCNRNKVNFWNLPLTDLEGNAVNLEQYKGKPIFLNFWATWCGPCRKEKPTIEAARKALADTDYVFLMISEEDPELIKRYKQAMPFDFTYLHIERNIKTLGVFYIPQTYIIGRDGKVKFEHQDMLNWSAPENLKKLRSFL